MIPVGPVPLALGALLVVSLIATVAWYRHSDSTTNDAPPVDSGPSASERLRAVFTDSRKRQLRIAGAITAVIAVFAALAAVAYIGWDLLAAALFVGAVIVGVTAPPAAIVGFREAVPNIVGVGLAVAAQVAFGKAGLVRREDGQYEWGVLREADDGGYYVDLAAGDRVPIDADDGELFAFGFGQLGVSEAHGENVEPFTETHTPGSSDAPVDTRAGVPVTPPRREEGGILVTLAAIQRRVRGSASSSLVRRGRDKALDSAGGTGQLSTLWTMAFATVLLLVGFAMTAGALML